MKDRILIKRLLGYAKPYWKSFLLVFFIMLFSIAYDIVSPLIIGRIEYLVKDDFLLTDLYRMVLVYAGILIISMICTYLQSVILQKIGQKILSKLRMDIFTHIESLSHEQLNNLPVGKLVTRVTNDTNSISMMFTNVLVTMVKNIMVIVGVLGAMLMLNYALTLMVLCFVPFIILFTVIFRKYSRKVHDSVNEARTDVNTYLSENLSGIKITQIFNQEEQKMEEFLEKSKSLQKAKLQRTFVFGIFRPMVYMLHISAILCLLYLGAKGYIEERVFFGQVIDSAVVVSFYMYISKFFNPIQTLAEQFDILQSSFSAAEKIFTILDMEPKVVDEEDAMELEDIRGEIEFQDVWFAYKEGEWVLKGVSFHVMPKQTVAFVGSTGSGKSTILSLIVRNYDIQKGRILIDGIDIRKIKISSLRKHFGQMLQDVFLFNGSVYENIAYGIENVTREQVINAAKVANAHNFIIEMENGYDTNIGDRGAKLSGGQRQRLAIARAVLKNPPILILDEATSALDTESERMVQDALTNLMKNRTSIVIAHRLSTIQNADEIVVLQKGEIIERGCHDELIKAKGLYSHLCELQDFK